MSLSKIEILESFIDGIIVGIGNAVLGIVIFLLLVIFTNVIKKLKGVKTILTVEVIIETAKANGINLDKFKDTYTAHELVELSEALLAGIPEEKFLEQHYTVAEIREELRNHYLVRPDVIVEEFVVDDYSDLPSLEDLPSYGIEPSYINLKTTAIPYTINGSIAYVESSNQKLMYQVMEIKEGTLLYKINNITFLIPRD